MTQGLSLIELINAQLASGKTRLPVFNQTAHKIRQETMQEDPDMGKIEKTIISDQSLTGEVLKIANSAFYKGLDQITTIKQAIIRIGYKQVADIVMLVSQKDNFKSEDAFISDTMGRLWQHSVGCAIGANWLAKHCSFHDLAGEAFFAGLLHDIGKLFLLSVIEDIRKKRVIDHLLSEPLLNEVMASLHTDQGHSLMKSWNLPDKYCDIARDHHEEAFDKKRHLLILVRLANMACNKAGMGMHTESDTLLTATTEADVLGLSEIDIAKLEVVLEDATRLA